MENLKNVISSFNIQDTLHPKMWVNNGEQINPEVRKNLLEITNQFIDSFGLDVVIDDVIITGSIANFNWSKYSDIDVHILVDYNQYSKQLKDMYVEFFDLKKIVFNQKRDVKFFGFDVEFFVEDADMKGVSDGVYSLLNNEWIKKPTKKQIKVNKAEIIRNSKKWMRLIDTLIKNLDGEDAESINNTVKKIKAKLKKYRLDGLKGGGELSLQNLVFKVLRRNGYIEKLYSEPIKLIDKKLSLKEAQLAAPLEKVEVGAKFGVVRPGLDTTKPHSGVDLRAKSGTNIFAPADGVVTKSNITDNNGGCGGTLFIKHKNGLESRFCHCKKIFVTQGDIVKKGQKVALVGGDKNDPGRGFSTGAHLHYTLAKDNVLVDPMNYIGGFEGSTEISSDLSKPNVATQSSYSKMFDVLKKPEYSDIDLTTLKDKKMTIPFLGMVSELIPKKIEFAKNKNIIFQNDITTIQKILKVLGYTEEDFKITGNFDIDTEEAVKNFQRENKLNVNGKVNTEDLKMLYFLLLINNITQEDIDNIKTDVVKEIDITDLIVYKQILNGLDIPITENNLKFLFALRNSLGIIPAKNNPFNVKYNLEDDLLMSNLKDTEIKNYSSIENGIRATIKTLKSPKYKCIIDGLKKNEILDDILTCPILGSLGLQSKMSNLLRNDNLVPIKIFK